MSNRTARHLTTRVGVIEQRLPPSRRKPPSLPSVALERVSKQRVPYEPPPENGRRKLNGADQERMFGEGAELPLQIDGRRILVSENLDVGAGATRDGRRLRAMSTAEIMHQRGTIDDDDWEACKTFEWLLTRILGHSEGVSSYGLSPGGADPTAKGDRRGTALTGYTIDWHAGQAATTPDDLRAARRNRSFLRDAALLLRAALGVEDTEGKWVLDHTKTVLLVRCVMRSAKPPTLDEIGTTFTLYGPNSKQKTAAAAGMLREMFSRMAMHLGLKKGTGWSEPLVRSLAERASD